jgi:hypothetical protein
MPRFYFDFVFGAERVDDVDGQELSDLSAARVAAALVAKDVMSHALMRDQRIDNAALEIRDADGHLIERLSIPQVCNLFVAGAD